MDGIYCNPIARQILSYKSKNYMAKISSEEKLPILSPTYSGWVHASAGTGKTKILIDRILNILLQGYPLQEILCITFTNVAAFEMKERLLKKLELWATCDEKTLKKELSHTMGFSSNEDFLTKAHALLLENLNNLWKIRIQTIHSFCKDLLTQFTLLTDLPPNFKMIEPTEIAPFINKARSLILNSSNPSLQKDLKILSSYFSISTFEKVLENSFQGITQFTPFFTHDLLSYESQLKEFFQHQPLSLTINDFKELIEMKKENPFLETCSSLEELYPLFFTTEGSIKKRLVKKEFEKNHPQEAKKLETLSKKLFNYKEQKNEEEIIKVTLSFLQVIKEIIAVYEKEKRNKGVIDFPDLIPKAKELLLSHQDQIRKEIIISHVLLDEAQDTSPDQWDFLLLLTETFYNSYTLKSFFVVGDQKQSIYSFQGAKPEVFLEMKKRIKEKFSKWFDHSMNHSFRNSQNILSLIDRTFTAFPKGVYDPHLINHTGESTSEGEITLLPLIEKETHQESDPWTPLSTPRTLITNESKQAAQIVKEIKALLKSEMCLPSTGYPPQPGDILILVRKRGPLVDEMSKSLKKNNIPVMGRDVFILKEELPIKDLIALIRFLCLPQDDYALACLLRSFIFGKEYQLTEEALFSLCYEREGFLWDSLKKKRQEDFIFNTLYTHLNTLLEKVDQEPTYLLIKSILANSTPYFIAEIGNEALETLEAFESILLEFSESLGGTLQDFLTFFENHDDTIKRKSVFNNQVRILTIHGSKGLEAPIVFIADSTSEPTLSQENFLWFHQEEKKFFLLKPKNALETLTIKKLKGEAKKNLLLEHQRLLYVALTRAKDKVYLGGLKNNSSNNWYQMVLSANEWKTKEDGAFIKSPSIALLKKKRNEPPIEQGLDIPSWLQRSLLTSPSLKKPSSSTSQTKRGEAIHKIFESFDHYSPKTFDEIKEKANFYREYLEEDDLLKIEKVFNDFAFLFSSVSFSEVPINYDGSLRKIDKLWIKDKEIWFLDFKTHKKVPSSLHEIQKEIKNQIEEYTLILKTLYPEKKIRSFILWVEKPKLMELVF